MNSSRLILIFLGIIFVLIIILSSSRIGSGLKNRLNSLFSRPVTTQIQDTQVQLEPTPTISEELTESPTPTVSVRTSTPPTESPATGAADIFWIATGSGLMISFWANRKSKNLGK